MGIERHLCRRVPIREIRPGDIVLHRWRRTVSSVETDGRRCYLVFENGTRTRPMEPDRLLAVEVRRLDEPRQNDQEPLSGALGSTVPVETAGENTRDIALAIGVPRKRATGLRLDRALTGTCRVASGRAVL